MKKPKFTPGPWSIVSSKFVEPSIYFPVRIASNYADLARVKDAQDARLIAAAPEMYAALELVCAKYTQTKASELSFGEVKLLQGLLAKVRGE